MYFLIVEDGIGRFSAEPSETSSVSYSMDGDDDSVWWVDGAASVDIEALRAQLAVAGSKQAQREIRYGYRWQLHVSFVEGLSLKGNFHYFAHARAGMTVIVS